QLDRGFTLTDLAAGRPVEVETLDDRGAYRTVRFLAADVPALGYKVFHMERGTGAAAQPAAAGVTLENRFYRVTLDPARGAIRGIFDKQLSRELVDSAGPYRLNEYLFVTGGGTNTRQAQPWEYLPPAELTVNHARDGKLISVERTPWGVVARMEAAAEHTPRIVTEIRLPDDARRIEIDNRMTVDLLLTRMAAYFAFPWAARQPTFRFDIANGWFDPAKDLMEGGGSEWFNAQHWVNVEDADAAMGLATASAPLVALGDIVRGRWPRRFAPASSAVFSYALTNYWSSKWAGRKTGEFAYAYAITSAPKFDPGQMMRFGYEQRNPLEVSEIKASDRLPDQKGPLPPDQASLAALAPESLMLTAAKGAEDGAGIVFRVMEIAGKDAEAKLTLPWSEIRSAHEANSLEIAGAALPHDAHTVSFHIGPHEVRTIRIE
ncbi:MAG: hypothetical protein LAQ30_32835, partial [Acidobacteriia bacterium]|nr:hypothetical protein [Terriglobia bacterium]